MKLHFKTPAKVNLGLHILRKREDGFHELETILQMVSLYDELELESSSSGVELECDTPGIPIDETNLACKAALLLQKTCRVENLGVRIRLKKKYSIWCRTGRGQWQCRGCAHGPEPFVGFKYEPGEAGGSGR